MRHFFLLNHWWFLCSLLNSLDLDRFTLLVLDNFIKLDMVGDWYQSESVFLLVEDKEGM